MIDTQNDSSANGVHGDDGFSNSTLVARAATGRNGIVNGSATTDAMIDTQNDSSTNGLVIKNKKIGGRGRNKCEKVAKLQDANKLKVEFFQKRAVGKNQNEFSRRLGFIVRNGNICPVRIKSFKEISPMDQDHMWAVVQVTL
ncbi:hypothetical protein Dimus_022827 [Dionaea muscipula]